ncbi:MAG: tRNA-binding protein [Acidobacteriota bacterium]
MNVAPLRPLIEFSVVEQIDIRIGTIERVEEVAGSTRLLRLIVDFGDHKRTILSGMKKERPHPQSLEGTQTLFVVNLAPRKMAGELSEGMLFDLGFADGIAPALAVPERPVPNGSRAG